MLEDRHESVRYDIVVAAIRAAEFCRVVPHLRAHAPIVEAEW